MALVMLALLAAFALAIAVVLADSGLRLWSAVAVIKGQRDAMVRGDIQLPHLRERREARATTRVSYARTDWVRCAPQRAAA